MAQVNQNKIKVKAIVKTQVIKAYVKATGPMGKDGKDGTPAIGVPDGGTTGQVLAKQSNANYDTVFKTLTKTDVGLSNVDNTSDANKPVSTAQATALNLKYDKTGGTITGSSLINNTSSGTTTTALLLKNNTASGGGVALDFQAAGVDGVYARIAALRTAVTNSPTDLVAYTSAGGAGTQVEGWRLKSDQTFVVPKLQLNQATTLGYVLTANNTNGTVGFQAIPAAKDVQKVVNVQDYGAVGNTVVLTDGAMTSGSAVLTSSSAVFTSADVGKSISVYGAATSGYTLLTTIASFQSTTQVTLAATANLTVSGAQFGYGTNDTTALSNATAAISTKSGKLYIPNGIYFNNNPITIGNYSSVTGESELGAILFNNGITIAGNGTSVSTLGIELNGRRAGASRYNGITVQGSNHYIDKISIRNFTNYGIELRNNNTYGGGCKNIYINSVDISNPLSCNCNGGSIIVLAGYNNIHIDNSILGTNTNNGNPIELYGVGDVSDPTANSYFYFNNNKVLGPFGKSGYFVGKKVHITNNDINWDIQIASAGGNENLADPALAFTSDSIVFEGNTIDTKTGTTNSSYIAVMAGAHFYTAHIINDVIVANNVFRDGFLKISDSDGDSGFTEEFARVSIRGNHFVSAYQSNIQIICRGNTMTLKSISIDNNIFYQWNSANSGLRYAIQVACLATAAPNAVLNMARFSISDNKFGPGLSGRTAAVRVQVANTTYNSFTGVINFERNDLTGVTVVEDVPNVLAYDTIDGGTA